MISLVGLVVWWFGGLVVWWFGGLVVWWNTKQKTCFSINRVFRSPAQNFQLALFGLTLCHAKT
jgi:hypothetical protein